MHLSMPKYDYSAIETDTGRECRGTVASASREQAAAELKSRRLAPTMLTLQDERRAGTGASTAASPGVDHRRVKKRHGILLGRVVSRKGLAVFTRQLATLVKAGMPMLRALEVLARSERNQAFKEVVEGLAEAIRSGGNFSDGLRQYPKVFDNLYVNMVKAGETGEVMDLVLDRLARFLERNERTKGRVKAAMTYPAVILVVAGSILTGLMVFVVPKFEQIFSGVLRGQPLPSLTRLVLGAGKFASQHFLAVLGMLAVLGLALGLARKTQAGTRIADWLLLKLPVLGDLSLKAALARFARTFGSLLASGVPILDALVITRETSGNVHVEQALNRVHDRVKAGDTVTRPFAAEALFPGLVSSMLEIGEETGALPDMLGRIADTYDEEVDNAVVALTSLIEPVMIVLMAVVVGVIVIALFLPIVGVIQHLQ